MEEPCGSDEFPLEEESVDAAEAAASSAPTLTDVRKAVFNAIFSEKLLMNPDTAEAAHLLESIVRDGVAGVSIRRKLLREFRDKKGGTLVHDFAAAGKLDCCRLLVQTVGMDINMKRKADGCTPLHIAMWNEHPDVAEGLVGLGGDRHIQNDFGETAEDTATAALGKSHKSVNEGDEPSRPQRQRRPRKGGRGGGRARKQGSSRSGATDIAVATKHGAMICAKLKEFNRRLVVSVVRGLGKPATQALLEKTLAIEEAGGMLVKTAEGSSRRRTPGGVFLHLARESCGPMEWKQMTEVDRRKKRQRKAVLKLRRKQRQSGGETS